MIKNLIFDVGEVLLGYRWLDMLTDHGIPKEQALFIGETIFDDPLWEELDLGNRPLDAIVQDYLRKYPAYKEALAWFLTHGEYMHVKRKDVWEKVHACKEKGYGIYLLSNYSEILFRTHTKDADFMRDIDGMVVSYQVHKIKPDPAIYLHLLQKYHLKPETCLFFDDRTANTEAARKLGITAITVTSKDMLLAELEKL